MWVQLLMGKVENAATLFSACRIISGGAGGECHGVSIVHPHSSVITTISRHVCGTFSNDKRD